MVYWFILFALKHLIHSVSLMFVLFFQCLPCIICYSSGFATKPNACHTKHKTLLLTCYTHETNDQMIHLFEGVSILIYLINKQLALYYKVNHQRQTWYICMRLVVVYDFLLTCLWFVSLVTLQRQQLQQLLPSPHFYVVCMQY